MKCLCLPALIMSLLVLGACVSAKDVPAYTDAQVLQVASAFSPECRVAKRDEGYSP